MSVAEEVGARRTRTLSTRFLRSELRLIFGRRRNLGGLLVLASVPVLISIAVKVSSPGRGGDGPDIFSSIAGEANIGTLRYLLAVPVQRARLLTVKYLAIVIFSLVATLTVSVTGIVMGLALFGGGDMTLLSGTQIGFGAGLLRVMAASLYLAVCFASLGAV